MISRIATAALLLAGCMAATAATAQTQEVLDKLHRKYKWVWPANEGIHLVKKGGERILTPVQYDGGFGFADTLGQEIAAPTYDHAVRFREGHAVVGKFIDGKVLHGLVDRTGREVIACRWETLSSVGNGVCVAEEGEGNDKKIYLVDTLGTVRPIEYNYCEPFENGFAVVGKGTYEIEGVETIPAEMLKKGLKQAYRFVGKYGYLAPDGTLAVPLRFDDARDFDEEGMAAVGLEGKYYIKYGFIDRTGKQVIPCDYYSVGGFHNSLAVAGKVVGPDKLAFGYIDRKGAEAIPFRFAEASPFRLPNTWVGLHLPDGSYAYLLINTEGRAVLPYAVMNLQEGGNGYVAAALPDDDGRIRYGVLDNMGQVRLPFEYDQVTIFSEWNEREGRFREGIMATRDGRQFSFDILP